MDFNRIVEEKIQQAMAAGEFDNLPGSGKPLKWDDNPYISSDWKLTFDLLKKNGVLLPWMEDRKEFESYLEKAIEDCRYNLRFHKKQARMEFFKQAQLINQKIIDYNLKVPVPVLQRGIINIQELFNKIAAEEEI